jgi:hypothetical protein
VEDDFTLEYLGLKTLAIAMVLGILLSFFMGFVENKYVFGIPESKYYGYPLVWRSVQFLQQPRITLYNFTNFTLDASFWIVICIVAILILGRIKPSAPKPKQ